MALMQLTFNPNDRCRVCLSLDNLLSLTEANRAKTLSEFLNSEITLNDRLPSKICSTCWEPCEGYRKTRDTLKQQLKQSETHLDSLKSLMASLDNGSSKDKSMEIVPGEADKIEKDGDEKKKKFDCEVEGCVKSYGTEAWLNHHKKTIHSDEAKLHPSFKCHWKGCGKTLKTKAGFKNHIDNHKRVVLQHIPSQNQA